MADTERVADAKRMADVDGSRYRELLLEDLADEDLGDAEPEPEVYFIHAIPNISDAEVLHTAVRAQSRLEVVIAILDELSRTAPDIDHYKSVCAERFRFCNCIGKGRRLRCVHVSTTINTFFSGSYGWRINKIPKEYLPTPRTGGRAVKATRFGNLQ